MRILTEKEVEDLFLIQGDYQIDNQGQVIIYTGIYVWSDGSYRNESEPDPDQDRVLVPIG